MQALPCLPQSALKAAGEFHRGIFSVSLCATSVSLCVILLMSHRVPQRITEFHREVFFLCVPLCHLGVSLCSAFYVSQSPTEDHRAPQRGLFSV